jgi:hypothetical protein
MAISLTRAKITNYARVDGLFYISNLPRAKVACKISTATTHEKPMGIELTRRRPTAAVRVLSSKLGERALLCRRNQT